MFFPIFYRAHTLAAGFVPPLLILLLGVLPQLLLAQQPLRYEAALPALPTERSQAVSPTGLQFRSGAQASPFSQGSSSSTGTNQIGTAFLPEYARENPSGYSYLCRLELKIEDQLPLGVWFQADGSNHPGGSIYLRLKMIRF